MKNRIIRFSEFIMVGLIVCFTKQGFTQTTIHTSNNYLLGVCGDTITLRGINYAPYNYGYDNTQLQLDQVAKTGANAVRMTWYASSSAPYYTYDLLDTAIHHCIQNKMIPIIDLHDITCSNDYNALYNLAKWYTSSQVTTIIAKYKSSLIINVANEAGYVNWDNDPTTALTIYKNTYDSITQLLRGAGITVPLMIDAPDCGTNITAFNTVALGIITNDPQHNVLFSAHAYWYAYANNDSTTMLNILTSAQSYGYPFVLGEVANLQDDQNPCQYTLNYTSLLHICQQLNIAWLAWCWDNDICSDRQLSSNGNYNSLTTYGKDVINNPDYGIHSTAKLTSYLYNNQLGCTAGIENLPNENSLFTLYYVNGIPYLESKTSSQLTISVFDLTGWQILGSRLASGATFMLINTDVAGLFLVKATSGNKIQLQKFINP